MSANRMSRANAVRSNQRANAVRPNTYRVEERKYAPSEVWNGKSRVFKAVIRIIAERLPWAEAKALKGTNKHYFIVRERRQDGSV